MEIRFGSYSLHSDQQELLGPEGPVEVEPQVFALLTFLAENADRVVSKDEIIAAVWDGRIVSDANLNSRINAARKAVGDDGKAQAVIRTYPRRGFRFVAEVGAGTPPMAEGTAGRSRVLILPFQNQSSDAEMDHFCEALTDDLIAVLSRARQFTIASRAAAQSLRGAPVDLTALWRDRGVRYVIDGAVRKMGGRLRVSALLSDAEADSVIWSEQYAHDDADLFAVEEEVVRYIAAAAEPNMQRADRQRALARSDPDAWGHVLRGWGHIQDRGVIGQEDEARMAIAEFRKAIALDPRLADAYGGLAHACWQIFAFNRPEDRENLMREGLANARKAVELNSYDADHAAGLGHVLVHLGRTEEGIAASRRAVAMASGDIRKQVFLGVGLVSGGHTEEAIQVLTFAREAGNQHFDYGASSSWLALALCFEGHPEQAEPYAREAVDNPITQYNANVALILSLIGQGRTGEAVEAREALEAFRPGITCRWIEALTPIAPPEFRKLMLDGLRATGLPK